jgi:two-component system, NtrC family, response regulator HydG
MINYKVLIIDDDQGLRLGIRSHLDGKGYTVLEAFDGIKGLEVFEANDPESFDFVLLDVDMPRLNGLETLKRLKVLSPATSVIMMTAFATIDNAVEAVKNGAFSYLQKPLHYTDLEAVMQKALKAQGYLESLKNSAPVFYDEKQKIIGHTESMQNIFTVIGRLSHVDTPVLIRGQSGTGKELVAKAIHYNSSRKDHPFVAVNCSAIAENLFESEFFGHEKGAFTGAEQRKIGKFQFADQGTLFLDELGDLPLHMQVKLLRVLQEKKFNPVGSNQEIEVDVRIIAATNRDLDQMILDNQFRDDLYYRLNVMPIVLPRLKDRINDLENLISVFVKKFNISHHKQVRKINPQALQCLRLYPWPGNIRELENVIEHAFILNDGPEILIQHLPEKILKNANVHLKINADFNESSVSVTGQTTDAVQDIKSSSVANNGPESKGESIDLVEVKSIKIEIDDMDFQKQKDEFEKRFIIEALRANKGKINQTALKSNIPKKTLLRKIEKYGIDAQSLK